MEPLVTFETAKKHLEFTGTSHEDEAIASKLAIAQNIVLDYIKQRRSDGDAWAVEVDAWTDETVPPRVAGAILEQLSELVRFRGDDAPGDAPKWEQGYLSPNIVRLLYRLRDPAIA